jgi:hypothetical protein
VVPRRTKTVHQTGATAENSKNRINIVPEKGGFIANLLTSTQLARF